MGRWGDLLFQGDMEFDMASDISADAGIEVYHYEIDEDPDPEFSFGGKGLEATRDHLNNGVLSRLFEEYKTKPMAYPTSREMRFILLGAVAMRLGATIEPQHMDLLRDIVHRCSGPMIDQIGEAVKYYRNNGKTYRFSSRGLIETTNDFEPYRLSQCQAPGCGLMNHELKDGDMLKQCGKCKAVAYCGVECQKAVWPEHKKVCGKSTTKAEATKKAALAH